MTTEEITEVLKAKFKEKVSGASFQTAHPHVLLAAEAWHEAALFLRDDPRLRFNFLRCISSVDLIEDNQLAAVYELCSMDGTPLADELWRSRHNLAVKVVVPRDKPHVPSVADVWPAAE